MRSLLGRVAGLLGVLAFSGTLLSCSPTPTPPPVTATVPFFQVMKIDAGGTLRHRKTETVLAIRLRIVNPGAEVRLLGYRYETEAGIVSEALMDKTLIEQSRSHLGRLVQFGLPTIFPAGSSTEGWVFFKTSEQKGRIHLSLRDVYGRFSALYLPLPPEVDRQGNKKDSKKPPPSAAGLP